ncbi:MAG: hypothetical protein ACE5Z5_14670 [Candidatus Bathyarchaeia archaeon]
MDLDGDEALHDVITRVKGEDSLVQRSLEKFQEALIEELVRG